MRWWMLAGLQYTLAKTPGGAAAYSRLQRRFGELRDISGTSRFRKVEDILARLSATVGNLERSTVVEIGTGWVPVVPMTLATVGARVFTYDVTPLVDDDLYRQTRDEMSKRLPRYAAAAMVSTHDARRRFAPLADCNTFADACRALKMQYDGKADTADLPHASESVDAVVSSLVLQCMPIECVDAVLAESFRVLKPGGYAVHRIRMTDENAAHDPDKNHFDYLQYSRSKYDRLFNHKLKYLNRLRASQFLTKMRAVGFNVYKAERVVDEASLDHVRELKVDEMFSGLDPEDLATTNLDVILEKPVSWDGVKPQNRPDLHYLADGSPTTSQPCENVGLASPNAATSEMS